MTFVSSVVRNTVARNGARRAMSDTPGPRMHKAKDAWAQIKNTRPVDPHPHNVFHPPYNPVAAGVGVVTVIFLGYGFMHNGMRHQQYKQGYWKK
mmetsp:Transcript_18636/g.17945  ORF Transcript_18636/g.17945 Transcript_18636/m.17945 type:complete len:94 (+) Transcript_18636:61-342(+)|eukprot:CAMPEP_0197840464 /NCGR_PEP_ID=MMETSP1437-20131217/45628_1 /TAXON_ID=49252 ORGANISM="Eucampia antarctica, Strain CCMP1452" /NCGR_SAMPLE_ID=MMETSP1437 /ASSEMBLY_ACC=CAM_ASM_001096 /LENGTH=93 /DNA_ID=CAMNT_0043450087 /DNA_START=557 /DNA_END=838 /DNA_ORIENTATION=-